MPVGKPDIEELLNQDKAHYCKGSDADVCVKIVAVADFPSRFGSFQIVAFFNNHDGKEHIAVVAGNVVDQEAVPVRLHSECLTGDALGSRRCDCGEQLARAMTMMSELGVGVLLYMRQEGRGIGLLNKVRSYQLQDVGYDTVEANLALGFEADERDYGIAAHMLRSLHVRSVRLITNNPKKMEALERHGVRVVGRIPLVVEPNEHNREYLRTKMEKAGHLLGEAFKDEDA